MRCVEGTYNRRESLPVQERPPEPRRDDGHDGPHAGEGEEGPRERSQRGQDQLHGERQGDGSSRDAASGQDRKSSLQLSSSPCQCKSGPIIVAFKICCAWVRQWQQCISNA